MQTEYDDLPLKRTWKIWWELIRPHTLTAAFVPVLLGTMIALLEDGVNWLLFAAMMIASILIQAATNLFNEYYDFKRGLDTEESVGIGGGIVRHGMTPKLIMTLALSMYGIALILGIYICAVSSWWLAGVGLVCMLVGYLYTGGPLPISYTPFGELFSGLFMGFLIILIAFFIQTGFVSTTAILIAIPSGILVGLINLSNNLRDHDGDKAHGRKTMPVVMGRKNALTFMAIMFAFSYLWLVGLVLAGSVTAWILLAFLSIPKALAAIKGFVGKTSPITMVPAMKATAQTNTFFGLLMAIGLFISYLI
ncbi:MULTISPECIES: 1,4-dihydroxy-2-naphthoate polyprenyltransferase [unclassified Peribacillus]|uniref:1,4-dihydroxy-2-naphthoate polyprenyltransferase n=1 Tax=unclassified Peribacillus TaxID=2675266 RepID=UPI00191344C5|nr:MULTISPECIES: 1,4-dihydroxy-2-naphthoate polyprenyltransferase [unclassified Peribacillus]MBK5443656.1 1,4-dihydroxy-2-naphthoate polyprenyltransferase [Peribacillus sp. TH24]MBK5461619.1 1,4-dihydroxy-2-naphthoate polyprenyltransferase [Peribacillus sp. TH27]MBK5485061.1 1,4-dihydroxy-2-naphthoate polyprenyltransferase [Peribacillus sp. TH16]MBK5499763.1 1,4-dihydroxy-2-naphthoate polyprenyltransferase [Peribacillus sp. TH14]WMX55152.1 1,4-dihydroxy-2-naphthoate polyprenyltransferase [Peri